MPDHVGKNHRIKKQIPWATTLAVNTVGEGMRKHIQLVLRMPPLPSE